LKEGECGAWRVFTGLIDVISEPKKTAPYDGRGLGELAEAR